MTTESRVWFSGLADRRYLAGATVLTGIAVAGLYYVKWNPYFHRAFVAAAQHSIGASIVSGKAASPPPPSVAAAVGYAWAYGKAIWQAMVLGLVLGAGVQALIPRDWLARVLGQMNFKGVAVAGLASVPSMM
jgi:uncharacterized membrane protein YraQ (UPF0718 family)